MPGGVRTEIRLTSEETGGAFCLIVDHPPAGWSLPAHRHRNEAETIHVVQGIFTVAIDGESRQLYAGDTIHIPRGMIHAGANLGPEPGLRVVLFSPAGMEHFFMEAGTPTPGKIDRAGALASAISHGWEFI